MLVFLILSLYVITKMTEEDKAKQDIIEAIFYAEEYGYGNKINTLKYARQININITMDDIHKLMNKSEI